MLMRATESPADYTEYQPRTPHMLQTDYPPEYFPDLDSPSSSSSTSTSASSWFPSTTPTWPSGFPEPSIYQFDENQLNGDWCSIGYEEQSDPSKIVLPTVVPDSHQQWDPNTPHSTTMLSESEMPHSWGVSNPHSGLICRSDIGPDQHPVCMPPSMYLLSPLPSTTDKSSSTCALELHQPKPQRPILPILMEPDSHDEGELESSEQALGQSSFSWDVEDSVHWVPDYQGYHSSQGLTWNEGYDDFVYY